MGDLYHPLQQIGHSFYVKRSGRGGLYKLSQTPKLFLMLPKFHIQTLFSRDREATLNMSLENLIFVTYLYYQNISCKYCGESCLSFSININRVSTAPENRDKGSRKDIMSRYREFKRDPDISLSMAPCIKASLWGRNSYIRRKLHPIDKIFFVKTSLYLKVSEIQRPSP